jgi:hypothetical protein
MTRRRLVKPLTIPSPVAYFVFALLIVIATAPTWRFAVFGFNSAFDDLLAFVCVTRP